MPARTAISSAARSKRRRGTRSGRVDDALHPSIRFELRDGSPTDVALSLDGFQTAGIEATTGWNVGRIRNRPCQLGSLVVGVDSVVVTGCIRSGCLRATVVDAGQHGFVPRESLEAVGDLYELHHVTSLFDLGMKYADVFELGTVIDYLGTVPTGDG